MADTAPAIAALEQARIVPVVVLDSAAGAADLADVLTAAGLPVIEVTFRTDAAEAALRAAAARPGAVVGAGTVVSAEQVDRAVDAGAAFVVSPGTAEPVVSRALELGVPVLPGVATASDLMTAVHAGLDLVKFFPAVPLGGLPMLSALAQPFPGVRFVPTGGIDAGNVQDFLAHPAVAAVGGTWMVPRRVLAAGDLEAVGRLARGARELVDGPARHAGTGS